MTPSELDDSIAWEAEQYIPFDIQDVNLDYQILDPGTGPDSNGSMEVLLVAAKKKIRRLHLGHRAGGTDARCRRCRCVRAAERIRSNFGLDPREVVVLMNAEASAVNINILQGDQSVFTRDISMGNAYGSQCKKAQPAIRVGGAGEESIPVDSATFEMRPMLHAVTDNVLLEIQKTFDFFKATVSSEQIDRIVLSGGASRVDGFNDMLLDRFGVPVEDFNPFSAIPGTEKLSGDPLEVAPTAAVAVGLALRRVGDR